MRMVNFITAPFETLVDWSVASITSTGETDSTSVTDVFTDFTLKRGKVREKNAKIYRNTYAIARQSILNV